MWVSGQMTLRMAEAKCYTIMEIRLKVSGTMTTALMALQYGHPKTATGERSRRSLLLVSSFDSTLYLRYEGFFVDGKKHGQGIYFYSDGSQYDGKLTVRNKEVINQLDAFLFIIGAWENDKRHGKGVMISKHGERYPLWSFNSLPVHILECLRFEDYDLTNFCLQI